MKICTICGLSKEESEYYKHSRMKDGLWKQCKVCIDTRNKMWREINAGRNRINARNHRAKDPEKHKIYSKKYHQVNSDRIKVLKRKNRLKHQYGLTAEDYDVMLSSQKYKCAICNKEDKLHIDHDHRTGKVRALLCTQCNTGLGKFKEDIELLKKAIDYIESHKNY